MDKTEKTAVTIGLLVVAAVAGYFLWDRFAEPPSAAKTTTSDEIETRVDDTGPRYPVPDTDAGAETTNLDPEQDKPEADEPLPPLAESDAPLRSDLKQRFGERPIEAFLVPEGVIKRLVVTIDNLDRTALKEQNWPVEPVDDAFMVAATDETGPGGEEIFLLNQHNADRYDPYVTALDSVDAQALVGLYLRYYPLFQQAYADLGYPDRYFNDRVVAVLDHLLKTPRVEYPIKLVQPSVFYKYADPELESLSWGQKTLIRMGPEHAANVKAKLRAIRNALVQRSEDARAQAGS